MEVILETTDIVEISFVKMLLSQEGIEVYVFDQNMSLLEGSISIIPVRIMALSHESNFARSILRKNGILSV